MGFNIPYTDKKRVVIIGGGFGGLKLAEKLKKSKFQVVLIDKNNYHQFPPLLYQVASSGLEYNEISFPYRKIFQKRKNFYFRLAEVSCNRRWNYHQLLWKQNDRGTVSTHENGRRGVSFTRHLIN